MSDIELVIKIPESTYKVFKNLSKIIDVLVYEKDILTLIKAVKNGTLLPKGHGRLIDADALIYKQTHHGGYYTPFELIDRNGLNSTPTIIESDKEQKDGKRV